MRKRFWTFVHNKLEAAWHWVYYHKIAEPPKPITGGYQYTVLYGNSQTGVFSNTPDIRVRREVKTDGIQST